MRQLREIVLVDDDRINNFLNHQLLSSLKITEGIRVFTHEEEALNYLLKECNAGRAPELIIFDNHIQ